MANSVFKDPAISVLMNESKTETGTGSSIFSDYLDIFVSLGLSKTFRDFNVAAKDKCAVISSSSNENMTYNNVQTP